MYSYDNLIDTIIIISSSIIVIISIPSITMQGLRGLFQNSSVRFGSVRKYICPGSVRPAFFGRVVARSGSVLFGLVPRLVPTYGQFSQFQILFCGLDPGNLKFETVRTNTKPICF